MGGICYDIDNTLYRVFPIIFDHSSLLELMLYLVVLDLARITDWHRLGRLRDACLVNLLGYDWHINQNSTMPKKNSLCRQSKGRQPQCCFQHVLGTVLC